MEMATAAPRRGGQARLWSDPASWPDGKVPRARATRSRSAATWTSSSTSAPPALRSLTIDGKLSFADERDLGLTTEWIYLPGGELEIGSEAQPYTPQRDDHPDRQRPRRRHQHDGRPRHHAA